jgi:hypothetical protein
MRQHFVVVIGPYNPCHAGMRVMHRLCHLLNVVGERAEVTTDVVNPAWNTPTATHFNAESIFIYPEVVHGNPCEARRVVRYVLNKPGVIGGDVRYGDQEMVWVYQKDFLAAAQEATSETLGEERILTLGVIEPEWFYHDRSIPKLYDCLYVGKGGATRERVHLQGEENMVRITRDFPTTRALTGKLLQGCRTLYSYDTCSALNGEALICGATVVLIHPDGSTTRHEPTPTNYVADYYYYSVSFACQLRSCP